VDSRMMVDVHLQLLPGDPKCSAPAKPSGHEGKELRRIERDTRFAPRTPEFTSQVGDHVTVARTGLLVRP
jgi:hypothetical protein